MRFAGMKSVLRNSGWLMCSHVASVAARIVYVIILARWLSPDSYGTLNYGLSWYLTLIGFTHLGLDVVISREVGRRREKGAALAGATLVLRGATIFGVWLISIAAAAALETDPLARNLLVVLSFALVGRAVWLWCGSVFAAFEASRHVMVLDFIFRPLELAALLLLLLLAGPNLIWIAAIHAAFWCCQAAVGAAIIFGRITLVDFSGLGGKAAELLAQGLPGSFYAMAVAWFLQAPIVLFRQVDGIGDTLGQFALAFQVVGYLQILPYIIATAALPVLSRSVARQDGKDRQSALLLLLLIPAVGAALWLVGKWLALPFVSFLFGPDYAPAGAMLAEALWLIIPLGLAIFLQQFIFAADLRSAWGTWSPLLGMGVMAASFLPLVDNLGYRGAIIATGLGMSVWASGAFGALVRSRFFVLRPAQGN